MVEHSPKILSSKEKATTSNFEFCGARVLGTSHSSIVPRVSLYAEATLAEAQ